MQCNTSIEDGLDGGDITFPSYSPEAEAQNRFLPRSEFPSVRQLVISKQKAEEEEKKMYLWEKWRTYL